MFRHELKCWPDPFDAIVRGDKYYEIRKEGDRAFAVGDELFLRKWDPVAKGYLDESLIVRVTYLTRGPSWGVPDGLVVMSIAPLRRTEAADGSGQSRQSRYEFCDHHLCSRALEVEDRHYCSDGRVYCAEHAIEATYPVLGDEAKSKKG